MCNILFEFIRGEEDKDIFMEKVLKVLKVYKVKCLKKPKSDVPAKKTAYNLFSKDMAETKEELKGVTTSKARAIISKEWKEIKDSDMAKKYKDLHETEKQQYEEDLQKYQEYHSDEVDIINLHKRLNIDVKTYAKTKSRRETDKKAKKPPRIVYHLFMRE